MRAVYPRRHPRGGRGRDPRAPRRRRRGARPPRSTSPTTGSTGLDETDVLAWWGHLGHDLVPDEAAARVQQRVLDGMGLVVLHSGAPVQAVRAPDGHELPPALARGRRPRARLDRQPVAPDRRRRAAGLLDPAAGDVRRVLRHPARRTSSSSSARSRAARSSAAAAASGAAEGGSSTSAPATRPTRLPPGRGAAGDRERRPLGPQRRAVPALPGRVDRVADRLVRVSLSIVQVGAGLWGRSWAELVARRRGSGSPPSSTPAGSARAWASDTLGVPTFTELERALRAVEADAVLLVSPPATHRPLAETAFAAGRHVITEKPLAPTLGDARGDRGGGAAHTAGSRWSARTTASAASRARSRRLVRDGTLGALRAIRVEFRRDLRNRWISPRDWRGRMAHPLLLDMSIHHVDLVRSITGRESSRSTPAAGRSATARSGTTRAPPRCSPSRTGRRSRTTAPGARRWAARRRGTATGSSSARRRGRRGPGRSTTRSGGRSRSSRTASARRRLQPPPLPALDRLGVLHEARRAIREGARAGVLGRRQPAHARGRAGARPSTELRAPVAVEHVSSAP